MKLSRPSHHFQISVERLTMHDGVSLSASVFRPRPRYSGEKFPVLLELLPYRKDDSFYLRDYPIYSYFAQRGYIVVKVDVRGTGSSEGTLPRREYSEQELADAVEVIAQLAALPDSNGKVGMWGVSWGGFNAIQVAMRRPIALKAIMAVHASDDLYHDDIHYIDGIYHVDPYALEIDHENGLPASPAYPLDEAYFRDRFEQKPWIFEYTRQQRDGEFWRRNSLRFNYAAINIPAYLIGGLLDGYRDSVPRMLEHMKTPVLAEVGPWNHTFPDIGVPGPNHDWRERALRFWDRWLKGKRNSVMKRPRFLVFVRDGHPPSVDLKQTPGRWQLEDWPIKRTVPSTWHATVSGALQRRPTKGRKSKPLELGYVSSAGVEGGYWWGETTGDMRRDDALSLVFDSTPLKRRLEIIGFPQVCLTVSTNAPLAHFVARLEDVAPDGSVSLVTGAGINGSQRDDRCVPTALAKGEHYALKFDLHFTTWSFKPGHRIRLALSNAQFPMLWPTPHPMECTFHVGSETGPRLTLPVIPAEERLQPWLPSPQPREMRPDAEHLADAFHLHNRVGSSDQNWRPSKEERNVLAHEATVSSGKAYSFRIRDAIFRVRQTTAYGTSDERPANSLFLGSTTTTIEWSHRTLELHTRIRVSSDKTHFDVRVTRAISENGKLVRRKRWRQRIRRDFQ